MPKRKLLGDLLEFQRSRHSSRCKVCGVPALHAVVNDLMDEVLAMKGGVAVSMEAIWRFLREKKSYGGTRQALEGHFKVHDPARWERWEKRQRAKE